MTQPIKNDPIQKTLKPSPELENIDKAKLDKLNRLKAWKQEALSWYHRSQIEEFGRFGIFTYRPIPLTDGRLLQIEADKKHNHLMTWKVVEPKRIGKDYISDDRFMDYVQAYIAAKTWLVDNKIDVISGDEYEHLLAEHQAKYQAN